MTGYVAMIKKEWMELTRSGRLIILLLVFLLFGIMNPAIAKLTPWMMDMMSESLKEQGLVLTEVKVDAMTSWEQFYKNIPIALIVFVLMCSSIFTSEYQKGTLIQVVAKGLSRWKILLSKATILLLLWSVCYWLCFGVTYLYNGYFWDNGIASHIGYAAVCYWLFGVWIIACIVLFSTMASTSTTVLLGTGGAALVLYMLGLLPKVATYLPIKLMDGLNILHGVSRPGEYCSAILITIGTTIIACIAAVSMFNRKRI